MSTPIKPPPIFVPADDVVEYSEKCLLITKTEKLGKDEEIDFHLFLPKSVIVKQTENGIWIQSWFQIKWKY